MRPALDVAERHDGFEILGILSGDTLEDLDRLVGAVGGIQIDGELDLRVALERRGRRHPLIDLDRHLRPLHRFIEIGEREQRQGMAGLEVERELEIDQRQILAAAAGQRGANAVERFGGAGLRGIGQRRHLLAGLGLAQAFHDQRMAGELLVERLVDGGRGGRVLVARQPARIGLGDTQHGIVQFVGALEPGAGVLLLAGELEDHAGVEVLEQRIPFRTGQLVDGRDTALGIARTIGGPARQQRGDEIGDRTADRLVDVGLRGRVLLELEIVHADDEARDAVGLVDGEDALGELDGFVDVTVGDRRDEGAVEQLVVLRVGAQSGAVERGGGGSVALDAGVAGGEIAAGGGERLQIVSGRKLHRRVGRMIRRLRQDRAGDRRDRCAHEGDGGNSPAVETI
ncbi:hypothetical protein ACVWW7_005554 [Bradyrhizobium sp. LM6.9]